MTSAANFRAVLSEKSILAYCFAMQVLDGIVTGVLGDASNDALLFSFHSCE